MFTILNVPSVPTKNIVYIDNIIKLLNNERFLFELKRP